MFITQAFAQAAGGTPATSDLFMQFVVPLLLILPIMWFFLIRPQQQKAKQHQDLLSKINRGDTVITNGGLIGRVIKVIDDHELQVEVGDNVKVRILRSGISEVRAQGEPVKSESR